MRKIILGSVLAAGLVAGGAGPAAAAPPEPEVFPVVCDNGATFDVEVNGMGSFTPARIIGSTGVLIPIRIGDFGYRAVLPDGKRVEATFPGEFLKGGGNVKERSPRPTVSCTFSETFTLFEDDPQFGLPAGTVVTYFGAVTAFLTGR